jgi:hypothetical protein
MRTKSIGQKLKGNKHSRPRIFSPQRHEGHKRDPRLCHEARPKTLMALEGLCFRVEINFQRAMVMGAVGAKFNGDGRVPEDFREIYGEPRVDHGGDVFCLWTAAPAAR